MYIQIPTASITCGMAGKRRFKKSSTYSRPATPARFSCESMISFGIMGIVIAVAVLYALPDLEEETTCDGVPAKEPVRKERAPRRSGSARRPVNSRQAESATPARANPSPSPNRVEKKEDLSTLVCDVVLIDSFEHDSKSFTQGLLIHNNILYESTGLYGKSKIIKTDLGSMEKIAEIQLNEKLFGEGIAVFNDYLYALTWKEEKILKFDLDLNLIQDYPLQGEGWGLEVSPKGDAFLLSNGTEYITYLDTETLQPTGKYLKIWFVQPKSPHPQPLRGINELEIIEGRLFANAYNNPFILVLDLEDGRVSHVLKTAHLPEVESQHAKKNDLNILNGIAYDKKSGRFLFTGKRWSKIYEIITPDLDNCQHQV